jgi:hypothetical protein
VKVAIKLYRRLVNHPDAKNTHFPIILWGYYDGLRYSFVEELNQYYEEDYSDQQNDEDINLNDEQQTYEIHRLWLYSHNYSKDDITQIFNEKFYQPLLVLTELKINNDLYQNPSGDLLAINRKITHQIIDTLSNISNNGNDFSFRVFSSLSYSDYVIVFRGGDYQKIGNAIMLLRGAKTTVSQNLSSHFLVNTTYSIAGSQNYSLNMANLENRYTISIRVSFRNHLDFNEAERIIRNETKFQDKTRLEILPVFGKYDLDLLLKNVTVNEYVSAFYFPKEYNIKGIFDPQSEFHQRYLGTTNTVWLLRLDNGAIVSPSNNQKIDLNYLKLDLDVIHSPSLKKAFQHLVNNYYQLERNDASDPLLIFELHKLINIFYWDIAENNEQIEKIGDGVSINSHKTDQLINIEMGVDLISQLLRSRIQAFRFFSEIPTYNGEFIHSASKIFVMYMAIVEEMEKKINEYYKLNLKRKYDSERKINFFITLSYSEKIKSFDLFPNAKKRIIPIRLSSFSFIDFNYAIPMLFHEMAHFIPNLNYKQLNLIIRRTICEWVSQRLVNILLTEEDRIVELLEDEHTKQLINSLSTILSQELEQQLILSNHNDAIENVKDYAENLATDLVNENGFLSSDINHHHKNIQHEIQSLQAQNINDVLLEKLDRNISKLFSIIEMGGNFHNIFNVVIDCLSKLSMAGYVSGEKRSDLEAELLILIDLIQKREDGLIRKWDRFLSLNWYEIIEKSINNSSLPTNEDLFYYLGQHSSLENTKINRKKLIKKILKYFNSENYKNTVNWITSDLSYLTNEVQADFYMCKLLNMDLHIYSELLKLSRFYMKENMTPEMDRELGFREEIISQVLTCSQNQNENVLTENLLMNDITEHSMIRIKQKLQYFFSNAYFSKDQFLGKNLTLIIDYFTKSAFKDGNSENAILRLLEEISISREAFK